MTKLEFNLTEKQEKYLKLLAKNHYPGAEDNAHTADPIHVVEKRKYEYIPYSEELVDYYGDYDLVYTDDESYEVWYADEVELVQEHYNNSLLEDIKMPIMSFDQMEGECVVDLDREEVCINSIDDYFIVYGVDIQAIAWKKPYWEPVAYFLIREEAERYREYQSHNLGHSRVYTHHMGYSNYGDLPVFLDMLYKIGEQLNEEDFLNEFKTESN